MGNASRGDGTIGTSASSVQCALSRVSCLQQQGGRRPDPRAVADMAARETGPPLFVSNARRDARDNSGTVVVRPALFGTVTLQEETEMTFGKGALLWLVGSRFPSSC